MNNTNQLTINQELIDQIKFDEKGLIPAIAQDGETGEILMMAYINAESLRKTLETGNATFWSRSRRKLWMKGETSGNTLKVQQILIDCDCDTLILKVTPAGPACHTGERTCFYRILANRKED
jgi:phosphoribosyl-AMP cyclohydrolase